MTAGTFAKLWRRWRQQREARRRRLARAAWDLRERYGAAAFSIACNSARQPVGLDQRRFWRDVARELRG
jgi:hypothetical protein